MESLNDALIGAVRALGGSKVVGPMLWPEKLPEPAQRALLDCLNPDRSHRLTPEQVALVLKKARQAGYHEATAWLMEYLGYADPVPISPRDEEAELTRQFVQATENMSQMLKRMEELRGAAPAPAPVRLVG